MGIVQELIQRARDRGRPCVKLVTSLAPARSYLGGCPELPAEVRWPSWNGAPLAFVAQIDLAATPWPTWPSWMPREGKLLFFYEPEQGAWGFDPKDRGSCAVILVNGEVVERNPPNELADFGRFTRKDMAFAEGNSFPSYERLEGYQADLSDDEFDEIHDFLAGNGDGPDQPHHQLFGWPIPIQNDSMELECQLASNGIYLGNPEGYSDPRAKPLEAGAKEWELLLQVDTDDGADMMWGDAGKLYFWIRRDDATRGDFTKVWAVLQCY